MTPWLVGLTIKATLLLLCLAAVATGFRRAAAATRHLVWATGLSALVLLPLLGALAPSWSPAWAGDWLPSYLLSHPPIDVAAVARATARSDSGPGGSGQEVYSAAVPRQRAIGGRTSIVARADGGAAASWAAGAARAAMAYWLLLAWGCGALVAVGRLGVGFARRAHLARRATAVEDGTIIHTRDAAARLLGMRHPVRLLLGDARLVPMTWGVVRPVLFLPEAAGHWSKRRLEAVLLHELAHIKRRDSLSRSLAQLACSTFWFHPLAWASACSMLREQERACDDVVLLTGADPHRYAQTLVAIAREFRSPRPSVVGALAFARRSNLEYRLLSILDPLERRKKLSPFRKALVLVLFAGVALPLAGFRPAASTQQHAGGAAMATPKSAGVTATSPQGPDAVPQADQQNKPRPAVVKRQGAAAVKAGGPAVAPRADAAVEQGRVVAPRPATGVGIGVVPRADVAVGQGGVVAPRPATGVGIGVAPRADIAVGQGAVAAPRPATTGVGIGVVAPRADAVPGAIGGNRPRPGSQRPLVRSVDEAGRIRLEASGVSRFGPAVADIELEDDGWLVLAERHRRLEIRRSEDGAVDIKYSVDGVQAEFDDRARQWADDLLEGIAEMGNVRGNVFISLTRSGIGGDLGPVAINPLEVTMEPMELAVDQLEFALQPLELTMEPMELAVDQLEFALQPLELTMEPLEFAVDPLEVTMEPLEFTAEPLEVALEPMELAVDQLELAVEPLELAVEHPLTVDGWDRFDHAYNWSDGGSRFAALWRGPVDVGATVDDIEVGPDGHLVIDERSADGVHRRLHVFGEEGGGMTFEWFVDGELVPFDESGRAWLQPALEWLRANGGGEPATL